MRQHTALKSSSRRAPRPFGGARQTRAQKSVLCAATNETSSSASTSRRGLLAGIALSWIATSSSAGAEPFLQSTGARGLLASEEEKLYNLRKEKEEEARQQINQIRKELEPTGATVDGKLCATPFGVDIVGITEVLALIGALVGGITARQRKDEVELLNEQLRKINLSLRQQARSGTVYAPGLTYAPVPKSAKSLTPSPDGTTAAASGVSAAVAVAAPPKPSNALQNSILSMEEDEMSPDQLSCRDALRAGKRLLKEQNGAAAMVRFEKALMLSKALADKIQERRATRGLAAAARLMGQYRAAIRHLERVLVISKEMQEYTGDADAFGTIADCYTDLGEFEKAASYYDKYIERMNNNTPL